MAGDELAGSRVPLYEIAFWIASKGGSQQLDTTVFDDPIPYTPHNRRDGWDYFAWVSGETILALDAAFAALLTAIHDGKLPVRGRRDDSESNPLEIISPGEFGDLYDLPYSYAPLQLLYSEARFLEDGQHGAVIRNRWRVFWCGLVVDANDVRRLWPGEKLSTFRQGRPPKFDWKLIEQEVFRLMEHHGEFDPCDPEWNAQARLEEALLQFCNSKFSSEPATSTLRTHLGRMLTKFRQFPKPG